jgi:hypothetical protein
MERRLHPKPGIPEKGASLREDFYRFTFFFIFVDGQA